MHDLVAAQARRTPQAIAVTCDGEEISYADLEMRARHVASSLNTMGVAPGDLVGICVRRTAAMVPTLLGVLKAGAAYVPLDPAYPADRLRFMLEDSRPAVVLCDDDLVGAIPSTAARLVSPATPRPGSGEESIGSLAGEAESGPRDLAYVLYTSGSTGNPKGVMVEHRSAVNLACWARDTFTESQRARVLLSTSLSWDLSIFELFTALCWGGTVVVVETAFALIDHKRPLDITLVNSVPTVISRVLDHGPLPSSVQVVNLAGEPLHAELVRRLHDLHPAVDVWNLYGPTETTTYSTAALVDRAASGGPPIGTSIAATTVHVVDENGHPVPVGEPGELLIGGVGLARGYLNQPDLTKARFAPDPFSTDPDARLYRTGDQVREDVDGTLWYLGRVDNQVKIRGLRVELGDIDSNLLRLPGVTEAITIVNGAGTRSPHLVAYVAASGPDLTAEVVRADLAELLPPHMIPPVVIVLDKLPLSPNGKIDRSKLPQPPAVGSTTTQAVRPLSGLEPEIAELFAELLDIDLPESPDDDFFDLGGDSLGALQLVIMIEQRMEVTILMSALFDRSTVAQLAALVDLVRHGDETAGSRSAGLVPLRSVGDLAPLFLGPSLPGTVRTYRELVAGMDSRRPVYALQMPGVDGEAAPLLSVADTANFLATEISRIRPDGPLLLGGFSFGAMVAVEAGLRLQREGRQIAAMVFLDENPFIQRPLWLVDPAERFRREWTEFRAAIRDHEFAAITSRKIDHLIRLIRKRRRGATRGRPVPLRDNSHLGVAQINDRAARSYLWPRMPFPISLIERSTATQFDGVAVARDRRAPRPVERHVIDDGDIRHRDFLKEPTASFVATVLDQTLARALKGDA